ncbi:MAG TPA: FG-GAP-like repeat-containing protein [Pyrinomonadaceae bacterium]|nr:FG-GAP-like repeat-containing protein [Pyrinomonadaceae bacterium]
MMLRFWIVVICAVIGLALLLTRESSVSETTAQSADPTQSREEAYRANNLGVALLEQFKHKEGADQFRKSLTLDPKLALARINLAIALFNVPDLPAAQKEATTATTAAPDVPHPHYILGLIAKQQGQVAEGVAAFQRVLKIDPRDVATNVQLGQLYAQQRKYPEAIQAFRIALAEEPYNGTALYNLGTVLIRSGERAEGQHVMKEFQALRESGAATIVGQNYLEQGRYAEAVISTGAEPDLVNRATPEVVFTDATETNLPATEPAGEGGSIEGFSGGATLFDYDGDGDLDLFEVAGTTLRLYRNDGGKFTDVTAQSGAFAKSSGIVGLGAVAGDFDNDEKPDLLLLTQGGLRLYRNEGDGKFGDVTTAAKIPNYPHLAVSAALVDIDHDGDLDIFIAGYSAAPKSPDGKQVSVGAPNMLLRNNGDGTFTDVTAAAGLAGTSRSIAVVPTDFDNRRDVDLLVVNYGSSPQLYRNMRDGSFRDIAADVGLNMKGGHTSVAAGDVNKDEFTDFFFGSDDSAGQFAMSDGRGRFNISGAPPGTKGALSAQFLDYDNDGLLDLVTVHADALRVHRNVGDGWIDVTEKTVGGELNKLSGPLASGDLDGDGDTDLVVGSEPGALKFLRNDGGNRNPSVNVQLAGKVSNRSGVGAKIEARAGSLRQKLESYATTPAPAPADILFGIGSRERVDAVRILWPSGVVQAETDFAGLKTPGKTESPLALTLPIIELDRKPSSCPFLYAWNGERFEFITDFMGGGEIGYWVAPGVRAAPDPDEYVRIRGDQLKERDGRYKLRVTNELEEALFIDRLQLVAVAHPAGVEVYPNEGLGNPTSSKFKLYSTRDARPPRAAWDDQGLDVLPRLLHVDRKYVDGFRLHRIRGYAEEHSLTLDLGPDSLKSPLLLMTGWTDYAFSSDNVAAAQTGLKLKAPALQVKDQKGNWRTVIENIGIPVGRPQTVAVDLTGKFLSSSREVRIVTNMRIYWDQILVDTSARDFPLRVERLEAIKADLRWRGFSASVTPDGREPFGYDYERVSFSSPWKVLPGRYTREGDVRELLTAVDDMFVVSRTGDELALEFDASVLQPLPSGWTRTFLLYADGFSKEMDINSASPHELGPLPFHGMKRYPYSAPERFPASPAHLDYLERYNTRVVTAPVGWASLR